MKPSPKRNDFAIRKIATDDAIPFRFVEKIISLKLKIVGNEVHFYAKDF